MRIKGAVAGVPQPQEGDVTLRNFAFRSGETPPELELRHHSPASPMRDAYGHYGDQLAETLKTMDANDLLYRIESADDFITPPELGTAEQKV